MAIHYSERRKIDPSQGTRLGDGTENNCDRVEIGPTALANAEWREAGLPLPNLEEMRKARHQRLTDAIVARGDRIGPAADAFAAKVADLLATHAPGRTQIGIDKIQPAGFENMSTYPLDERLVG